MRNPLSLSMDENILRPCTVGDEVTSHNAAVTFSELGGRRLDSIPAITSGKDSALPPIILNRSKGIFTWLILGDSNLLSTSLMLC